jgi:predicted O-methyltransferase YrrM
MAYHGYIPYIKSFLSKIENPTVLEIGLDVGMTTIPLISFLSRFHKKFEFYGIDVLVREQLKIILSNIDRNKEQKIKLLEENSLKILPAIVEANMKFDLILIDGDHNYYTVSQELNYLNSISKDNSLIIIDDYYGRWSERDMWYCEREEYKNIDSAKKIVTEKQGVKTAVDEFVSRENEWEIFQLLKGEPVIIKKKEK